MDIDPDISLSIWPIAELKLKVAFTSLDSRSCELLFYYINSFRYYLQNIWNTPYILLYLDCLSN